MPAEHFNDTVCPMCDCPPRRAHRPGCPYPVAVVTATGLWRLRTTPSTPAELLLQSSSRTAMERWIHLGRPLP